MVIADMNQRITIQQHKTDTDDIGNHTSEWTDLVTVWANVKVQSSSESDGTDAGVTAMQNTLSVIIRQSSLTAQLCSNCYRLVFHGAPYNITGVQPYYTSGDYVQLTSTLERV